MDIRPILSTLLRHKTAAALIVLEIALSCAIICNALFLIGNRMERMQRPTGLADDQIVRINSASVSNDDDGEAARTKEDVAALRAIPGVIAATSTNHLPFDNSSWNSSLSLEPNQRNPNLNANVYQGDEQLIETFGLKIIEGRDFEPGEYIDWQKLEEPDADLSGGTLIVSRRVAEKLFPGESALGKPIYAWGDKPLTVVGVVENLIRTNDNGGPAESQYSIIMPVRTSNGRFALRTSPERRDEVLKAAVAVLQKNSANRIILDQGRFSEMIDKWYRNDRAMAWLLGIVIIALLVVTALGIVGLASFWVQQRTKQIGVRRALGATRGQILRYFQTENFLLATIGIVLGMLLAYAINQLLMSKYELPRLPLYYLPIGAVLLWLLGQIAVYGPARKAASVPPAVATRSA
ncbi:MAG: FtsX-like permease family protein [Burkholderiales bacterium]|nr:MAG: FtsX-like permease family protein [Burkholderiales bacterium]